MGVCARAGRGQQDKQSSEDEDLYLGFSLCWALCACAWPKAEPCVGVCGHVSVEVISLNFLLKCQLTCSLVERVNIRIDMLSFCLCSGEQQCQGRSRKTVQRGFGNRLVCRAWTSGVFKRGEWAHLGGYTALLLSFDLNGVCSCFSTMRSFAQVLIFIPVHWAAVFWARSCCWVCLGCCDRRGHGRRQLTPTCPHCSYAKGQRNLKSITVHPSACPGWIAAACMPENRMALAELHVFSCRNGLILLLDWQHFFAVGYWLSPWRNLWFLRL